MKKVLFIMYSLDCGGAQSVLINLANNLPKDKVNVTIHTLFGNGAIEDRLSDEVTYKSIFHVKNAFIRKLLSALFQYVIPQKFIYNHFYKNQYDGEVAYMEGYPTKVLAESTCPNKIAWVHIDMEAYTKQDRLFRNIQEERNAYESYDKIVCVSECVREAFERKFGFKDKTSVIYNILDDKTIKENAAENPYDHDVIRTIHFVTVGNIIPRKRLERLILAVAELRYRGVENSYLVHIVGDGDDASLRRLAEEKSVSDCIRFEGFKANPYPYIGHADAYVCTSEVEGYSTTIAESFILGIPVISTKSAGTVEVMGMDAADNIIEQTDSEEEIIDRLADAMEAIICSPEERMRYKHESVLRGRSFNKEDSINEILNLFECEK